MAKNKPETKKREPEPEQVPAGTTSICGNATGTAYKPVAAPEPALIDRVKALELANIELEEKLLKMDRFIVRVAKDHSYSYGGSI